MKNFKLTLDRQVSADEAAESEAEAGGDGEQEALIHSGLLEKKGAGTFVMHAGA